MDGWELLGKFTEEEERRPLEIRLAEREGRSLLLHEGVIYDFRECPMEGVAGRCYFTLGPVAAIDEDQDSAVRATADLRCRSDDVGRSAHNDEEVAKHVTTLRRAKAIKGLLADFDLTNADNWYREPLVR